MGDGDSFSSSEHQQVETDKAKWHVPSTDGALEYLTNQVNPASHLSLEPRAAATAENLRKQRKIFFAWRIPRQET
jgi:hypothetical protein